ncbi:hypothetical protein BKA59DRAFT_545571 [Fusarium tricinctum]|uniref:Uncharacterized protein n=1 Tax=Fusarium tricinctum TaxID=61284 RepID=A0A8K0RXB1_9HYPO|nr:hypothetical protein BKA59DRAFT_545571 [Fusarium tricinctum]
MAQHDNQQKNHHIPRSSPVSMRGSHTGGHQQPPVRRINLTRGGRVSLATGVITGVVAALISGTGRGSRPGAGLVSFAGHQKGELRLQDAHQYRSRNSLREDLRRVSRDTEAAHRRSFLPLVIARW